VVKIALRLPGHTKRLLSPFQNERVFLLSKSSNNYKTLYSKAFGRFPNLPEQILALGQQ
jgi:hypothetical protein